MGDTALLVLDVQQGLVDALGATAVVEGPVRAAVGAARRAGVPVVFVAVRLRAGAPEVPAGEVGFAAAAAGGAFAEGSPAVELHPALAAGPDDLVVVKRRVSAFAGSDLDVLLRGLGVARVALCGLTTGGVVLSTLREAADRDLEVVVLADACADPDPEVHRVLVERLFPQQAAVLTVGAWAAGPG